mmetsp:Transcript_32491/g.76295  ORF Transcript_32491/g.76295 Transcript_32491/m.76295 type:complete len:203 (+) Transcript_32491:42-650(+)
MSPPSVSTVTVSTSVRIVIFSDAAAGTAAAGTAPGALTDGTAEVALPGAAATGLGCGANIDGCPLCFCQPSHNRTRDIVNTTHSTVRRISVMRGLGGRSRCAGARHGGEGQAGKQTRRILGHGVVPAIAPGAATQDAVHGQVAAGPCAVLLQRRQRVARAGRLKAAGVAQPRAQQQAIASHQGHQRTGGPARLHATASGLGS